MNLYDLFNEEKVRLDPKCWTGKKIGNPKTKMKGGVRVNNCVPAESVAEGTRASNEVGGADSMRQKLGNIIKQAVQNDEGAYNASGLYRKLWDIYGGDIDAIIAERSIFELQKLARELVSVGKQGMSENATPQLNVQQLATISDAALDAAYGYGRSTPGNTFGWQANLKSAAYAKQMIDQGVTDIEAISDAIHKGWNTTAQAFVQDPEQFDDTAKLAAAGKLEAKLQQRAQLMKQNYAQLPEEEKEKDRVVARALLQAIRGEQQQGVAEAQTDYQKRRQRERDVDAGKPVKPPPKNPQNDYFARRKKEQDMAEGVMYGAENLHVGDPVVITGNVEFEGKTGDIVDFGQDKRFVVVDLYNHGRHSFHSSDVSANDYDNDEHDDDVLDEKSVSQAQFRTMAAAAHNPKFAKKVGISQDVAREFNQADKHSNYKKLPDRATEENERGRGRPVAGEWDTSSGKVGRVEKTATGLRHHADPSRYGGTIPEPEHDKLLTPQERWRMDKITQPIDDMDEGEQQKGADYRDPKEVNYDDEYDAMVARVKKLAGLGPMKTVYDPARRQYRNMPTAVQPKK